MSDDDLFGDASDEGDMFGEEGGITTTTSTTAGDEDLKNIRLSDTKEYVIPGLPTPLNSFSKTTDTMLYDLPQTVGITMQAYDPDTYDEEEEKHVLKLKDKVFRFNNIIRWRYQADELGNTIIGEDGQGIMESNARFVTWSDGSTMLMIGDEAFEANIVDVNLPSYLCCKSTAHINNDEEATETLLEAHYKLKKRVKTMPHIPTSKTHRLMKATLKIEKNVPQAKLIATDVNPELRQNEMIRKFDETSRKEARAREEGDRDQWKRKNPTYMSKEFLDDDDDDDNYGYDDEGGNLKQIKEKFRSGSIDDFIDSDNSEDEEGDWVGNKRNGRKRKLSDVGGDDKEDLDISDVEESKGSSGGGKNSGQSAGKERSNPVKRPAGEGSASLGSDNSEEEEDDDDDDDEEEEVIVNKAKRRKKAIDDEDSD